MNREKRVAAIAGEEITKNIASELAVSAPPSPHTLPSLLRRTPSPTPDQQLQRELQEMGGNGGHTRGSSGGSGRVRIRDSRTPSISASGPASLSHMASGGGSGGGSREVVLARNSRTPSISASSSQNQMILTDQVIAIQRKQREGKQGKMDVAVQGQRKSPTPSKIIKLPIPTQKMLELSSSPPQPSDGQGNVMMSGTLSSGSRIQARAWAQLRDSLPEDQARLLSQAQMNSSPPQAFGSSPPLPQHRRRPSQIASSPPSVGTYRGPGELHSSPPEVKLSRARAQSQNRPTTPQNNLTMPHYTNDTPPGFPAGFNDPRVNPTVPAFATARQPLSIASTGRVFDASRITIGLPQKEIDRIIRDPRKQGSPSRSKNRDRLEQATRTWADPAPPAKRQNFGLLPSPTTPQLQSMAEKAEGLRRELGHPLGLNPTAQQLLDFVEMLEARPNNVVRNPTPEELAQRNIIMQAQIHALNQARIHNMSPAEQQRFQIKLQQMQAGMGYSEQMVPRIFNNMTAVNTNGPSIGLRLNNPQSTSGHIGPLIQRRIKKLEPLANVLAETESYIEHLMAGKPLVRDREILAPTELVADAWIKQLNVTTRVPHEKETQEEQNETRTQSLDGKEAWGNFMDIDWVSEPEDSGDELMIISRPLTPRPGFAPPIEEVVHISEESEELRRMRIIAATFKNYHFAMREGLENETVPSERPHPAVSYPMLALSRLQCAPKTPRKDPPLFGTYWNSETFGRMDNNGCTFCLYECDFGIYDFRVLLPEEASLGYCWDCHTECNNASKVQVFQRVPEYPSGDPKEISFYKTQEEIDDYIGVSVTCQSRSDQVLDNKGKERTLKELSSKAYTAIAPLKEVGKMFGHEAQAENFSSDSTRQQAIKMAYPKEAFEAAMKAGQGRGAAQNSMVTGRTAEASINGVGRIIANISGAMQNANRSMKGSGRAGSDQSISTASAMPTFLANRPPRPSPLAVVTDMSPVKNTFAESITASTPASNQHLGGSRPINSLNADNSNLTGKQPTVGVETAEDTAITLAPLTGESFNHIMIPASPQSATSSRQSSSDGSQGTSNSDEGPPRKRRRALSVIDGMDISDHRLPGFCRGSPWRQVDVLKARICDECRYEKFYIIKHRHMQWNLVVNGEEVRAERRTQNCMICPGTAMYTCAGCPLRLCSDCQTMLSTQCKGWLNNLIYHYGRAHVRNDTFLLRSDAQGF